MLARAIPCWHWPVMLAGGETVDGLDWGDGWPIPYSKRGRRRRADGVILEDAFHFLAAQLPLFRGVDARAVVHHHHVGQVRPHRQFIHARHGSQRRLDGWDGNFARVRPRPEIARLRRGRIGTEHDGGKQEGEKHQVALFHKPLVEDFVRRLRPRRDKCKCAVRQSRSKWSITNGNGCTLIWQIKLTEFERQGNEGNEELMRIE